MTFEWDEAKNRLNCEKHGVSFETAQMAFFDPARIILEDKKHGSDEKRYFCIGAVDSMVITVRFTVRHEKIRIFGAGYWRQGRKLYEKNT